MSANPTLEAARTLEDLEVAGPMAIRNNAAALASDHKQALRSLVETCEPSEARDRLLSNLDDPGFTYHHVHPSVAGLDEKAMRRCTFAEGRAVALQDGQRWTMAPITPDALARSPHLFTWLCWSMGDPAKELEAMPHIFSALIAQNYRLAESEAMFLSPVDHFARNRVREAVRDLVREGRDIINAYRPDGR